MTKSIPPSSFTHFSTATCMLSILLTSTDPRPKTFAPCLAVAISLAIFSVLSTFRPTMQALAPRWTMALTWALQMVPAPPVQKTTLFSGMNDLAPRKQHGLEKGVKIGTENAIFPNIAHVLMLGERHFEGSNERRAGMCFFFQNLEPVYTDTLSRRIVPESSDGFKTRYMQERAREMESTSARLQSRGLFTSLILSYCTVKQPSLLLHIKYYRGTFNPKSWPCIETARKENKTASSSLSRGTSERGSAASD